MMKLEKGLSRSTRILHFLVETERHTASGLIRLNFLAKLRCKHIDKTKGSQYNRKGCIVLLSSTFRSHRLLPSKISLCTQPFIHLMVIALLSDNLKLIFSLSG
uniref:Uncharacterized protein n=1 Tax=Opuntia streptacantha TaxID=393608 RepID=A0A7C9AUP3_OPUST